jgi:hypothetical protein
MSLNTKVIDKIYEDFFERLIEVLDDEPLSFWQEHLGSTAVIQSRWKKGKFPGSAKLIELCRISNISPTWLLLGIGDKKIPIDEYSLNKSFAREYLKNNLYKIRDIDFFLDIFLNLSLEDLKKVNNIPIKNIFIESENFIQKLNLLQKALEKSVDSLREELTGNVSRKKQKQQYILSFDKDDNLIFANNFFLQKFNLNKTDIINTKYKLPISEKDQERVKNLFKNINVNISNVFSARIRVLVGGSEEWQYWETTTFVEQGGGFSRKSIGQTLSPEEIRQQDL